MVPGGEVLVVANAGVTVGRPGDAGAALVSDAESALRAARATGGGEPVVHGSQGSE